MQKGSHNVDERSSAQPVPQRQKRYEWARPSDDDRTAPTKEPVITGQKGITSICLRINGIDMRTCSLTAEYRVYPVSLQLLRMSHKMMYQSLHRHLNVVTSMTRWVFP
jgi:hypothetical protein